MEAHRDEVDEWHSVVVDAPQRHDAHSVHGDHDDGEKVEETGEQVHAQEDTAHHEGGQQAHRDVEEALGDDGQVLLVEHIRHPAPGERQAATVTHQ